MLEYLLIWTGRVWGKCPQTSMHGWHWYWAVWVWMSFGQHMWLQFILFSFRQGSVLSLLAWKIVPRYICQDISWQPNWILPFYLILMVQVLSIWYLYKSLLLGVGITSKTFFGVCTMIYWYPPQACRSLPSWGKSTLIVQFLFVNSDVTYLPSITSCKNNILQQGI